MLDKNKRYRIFFTILVILFFLLFLFFVWQWGNFFLGNENQKENFKNSFSELFFDNGAIIRLEIADTPERRARGLSGRVHLNEDTGLFFIFDESGWHGIWMKEMNFPIDIIWLNQDLQVVGLKIDARPETFPEVFYPDAPALYVLEVNAGFIGKNSIEINQKTELR